MTVYWAPNGKYLLYYVTNGKNSEMWEISIEGGIPRRLDQSTSRILYPSFHSDGKRIAFVSFDPQIDEGIYVIENLPPIKSSSK